MVGRIRRDAVNAGRSRAGHSLHAWPVYQTVEPGFRLGSFEHFCRRRFGRNIVRDRHPVRWLADRSMGYPDHSASDRRTFSVEYRCDCLDSILVFMLFFAITGFLGSGQGPLAYAKCVSAWFDDKRGLALGIP